MVGVVGSGMMGRQIALCSAMAGHPVILVRATPGPLEDKKAALSREARMAARQGGLQGPEEILARIRWTIELPGVRECTLVVESVAEDYGIKRAVYDALAPSLGKSAVLCTNTSALRLSVLSEGLKDLAERFVGLHFFSPAYAIPVVELGRHSRTSDDSVATVKAFAAGLSKTPVVVSDAPGYIVNRVLFAAIASAAELVSEGVATPEAVDQAVRGALGWPTGPFKLAERIGTGLCAQICRALESEYRQGRFVMPDRGDRGG
jgi:3-hydroxybutyryl-CoA dehydrogenase